MNAADLNPKLQRMKKLFPELLPLLISLAGCGQPTSTAGTDPLKEIKVGGECEGCEAIHESPVPFEKLSNLCWLPDWEDKTRLPDGQGTRLAVNGIVYLQDGTPAAGVIIYIYHTDQTGIYPVKGDETGWGKRHGRLRGWMKTNEKGEYKFFTLKPGSYPESRNPAHIHVTIKEPGKTEYWIDDYLFDDDPFLTPSERKHIQGRGGNGILQTKDVGNMLKAERHIYLGKNIPGYPGK